MANVDRDVLDTVMPNVDRDVLDRVERAVGLNISQSLIRALLARAEGVTDRLAAPYETNNKQALGNLWMRNLKDQSENSSLTPE